MSCSHEAAGRGLRFGLAGPDVDASARPLIERSLPVPPRRIPAA
ncbi:hypothetical protein ACFSQ7_41700 [Paenibacillus rhizoplanae]